MPSKTKNPLADAMRELQADPTPAAVPVEQTTPAGNPMEPRKIFNPSWLTLPERRLVHWRDERRGSLLQFIRKP